MFPALDALTRCPLTLEVSETFSAHRVWLSVFSELAYVSLSYVVFQDILNNLDSCDLADDDLMLDADFPEDGSLHSGTSERVQISLIPVKSNDGSQ